MDQLHVVGQDQLTGASAPKSPNELDGSKQEPMSQKATLGSFKEQNEVTNAYGEEEKDKRRQVYASEGKADNVAAVYQEGEDKAD